MKLAKVDFGLTKLREDFPGKLNKWEIIEGANLKLVKSYPDFQSDLESALDELERNNSISKAVCGKIQDGIKSNILTSDAYKQLSKWCDWNQKSSETLAKNISRILFGFDIPRIVNKKDKVIDENIIDSFLSNVTGAKPLQDKARIEPQADLVEDKSKELIPEEISKKYKEYVQEKRIKFITFHPSYSYEEFIEGITVEIESEKEASEEIKYKLKPGIFKDLCKRALGAAIGLSKEEIETKYWKDVYEAYRATAVPVDFDAAPKYVLIIDEINRGDIAKIFGELITLVEDDKRIGSENELTAMLPTSGDEFGVPKNIFIIATMNTADRSIALLDVALRRRFGFVEMAPDFDVLNLEHVEINKEELEKTNVYKYLKDSIESVEKINANIIDNLGRDKQIGHSFFFKVKDQKDLMMVWQYEILPLLEEYYYCDYDKILKTLDIRPDNLYFNKNVGIRGFKKIEELEKFLNEIRKRESSSNE